MEKKASSEKAVRDIRRKTRRKFSAEEKIRIVIEGLRGEESIASRTRSFCFFGVGGKGAPPP
jgi:transposase